MGCIDFFLFLFLVGTIISLKQAATKAENRCFHNYHLVGHILLAPQKLCFGKILFYKSVRYINSSPVRRLKRKHV